MDDELELPDNIEEALIREPDHDAVIISQELGCAFPRAILVPRVNRFFREQDLGYKPVSGDTFKLKVRPRNYPFFGSFSGHVHIMEKLGHATRHRHLYRFEGLLQYRLSVIWFIGVFSFFFLLVYIAHPGLWVGALFLAIGSGLCIVASYTAGKNQREEIEERVENTFLQLRATVENIR